MCPDRLAQARRFICRADEPGAGGSICQGPPMPEVIFTGPAGRLEGRYHPAKRRMRRLRWCCTRTAVCWHHEPPDHLPVLLRLCAEVLVLRFNFPQRRPQPGSFDHGTGELSDAHPRSTGRRPSIRKPARILGGGVFVRRLDRHAAIDAAARGRAFISIRAARQPLRLYTRSWRLPSSGLIVHGEKDAVVPPKDDQHAGRKLKTQKAIVIDQQIIPSANHFFDGKLQPLDQDR